ncbi:MAG: ankyrin repeat domain-containing protein [Planctomycetes bacterium]|nr:ankyrin repeat domain-containing protein [Planctomycetota bacterium]
MKVINQSFVSRTSAFRFPKGLGLLLLAAFICQGATLASQEAPPTDAVQAELFAQAKREQVAPLFLAIEMGDTEGALRQIEELSRISRYSALEVRIKGDQALHVAARLGRLSMVKALVEAGAPLATLSGANTSPVGEAIAYKHLETGSYLLETIEGAEDRTRISRDCIRFVQDLASLRLVVGFTADFGPTEQDPGSRILLATAARFGDAETVMRALAAGADFEPYMELLGFSLVVAAGNGHLDVLQLLIGAGIDLEDGVDITGTALTRAAAGGHLECVRALLQAGAELENTVHLGGTALQNAAANGHQDVVALLISAGASLGVEGTRENQLVNSAIEGGLELLLLRLHRLGWIPKSIGSDFKGTAAQHMLEIAVENRQADMLPFILKLGADVNLRSGYLGRTPLQSAMAVRGNDACIQVLKEAGALFTHDQKDLRGVTLLHLASRNNYIGAMRDLIVATAVVDARANDQDDRRTPLHMAVMGDDKDAIVTLTRSGADLNALDAFDRTPLYLAQGRMDGSSVRILIPGGADPDVGGGDNEPPLFEALRTGEAWRTGKEEKVRALLENGANVNILHKGYSGLHVVAEVGGWELAAYMLDAGADRTLLDANGKTAREVALESGHSLVAYVLKPAPSDDLILAVGTMDLDGMRKALAAGANPTQPLSDGSTPLHQFARQKAKGIDAARLFLAAGADPNALDAAGNTALSELIGPGADKEFIALMVELGARSGLGKESAFSLARRLGDPAITDLLSQPIGIERVMIIGRAGFAHPAEQASRTCEAYASRGDYVHALQYAEIAVGHKRWSSKYLLYRGKLRVVTGDYEGALEDYKFLYRFKSSWLEARVEYGLLAVEMGDFEEAMVHLDYVIARIFRAPDVKLHLARGRARAALGDLKGGLEDLILASENPPRRMDVLRHLGIVQKASGDDAAACQSWKTAAQGGDSQATKLLEEHCK